MNEKPILTISTSPKPFTGHVAVIQRNAIRSWMALQPACDILLFGNDAGTAEIAAEFGLRHVPQVAQNEFGIPLVSDLFDRASHLAKSSLLCYANADIIFLDDFTEAVMRASARKQRFLMVGRRWDLDITEPLDFNDSRWQERIRSEVSARGSLHSEWAIDYFVFPQGMWGKIPPFAIGRPYFDNWLIWRARSLRVPVIDATAVVNCIHQNHEARYTLLGQHKETKDASVQVAVKKNYELAEDHFFTIRDATHLLTPKGLKCTLDRAHIWRHLDTIPMLRPHLRLPIQLLLKFFNSCRPLLERLGLIQP